MNQLKDLTKNLTKNWITTTIGVLIIIASIVSRFVPELGADWMEVSVGIGIGVLFLGLPDPKKPGSTAAALALLLLSSCVTFDRCVDKYGDLGDTTYISREVQVKVPYLVYAPADSITELNVDSLISLTTLYGDTLEVLGKRNQALLKLWRSASGVQAQVICPEDTLEGEAEALVPIEVPCPPQPVFKPPNPSKWALWLDHFRWLCTGLVCMYLLIFTFKKIR